MPDDSSYFNKTIPITLESEIKQALSYFPELKNTPIDFIFRDKIKNATMQAQPRVKTLFKRKSKRTYKIKISRFILINDQPRPIEEIPSGILVGWIAHELGHIMDYLDRSCLQMVGFGVRYITSQSFLINAERRADVHAIQHGFGDSIIETKRFILHENGIAEEYKQRIHRLYISPDEVELIQQQMESHL